MRAIAQGGGGGGVPNTPRPDLSMKAAAAAKDGAGAGRGNAPDLFAVPEVVGEQRARGGRAHFVGASGGWEAEKEGWGVRAAEAGNGLLTPMREALEGVGGEEGTEETENVGGRAQAASLHNLNKSDSFR